MRFKRRCSAPSISILRNTYASGGSFSNHCATSTFAATKKRKHDKLMVTFSQNADLFTRAINCTAKITVCNLSTFLPLEKTSSKFQIIHYSRAQCRRDMAIQNYGDDVSFISNLDAVDIPVKVLNQCVAPKFCNDLGEMTQASCGLKHMIGWWIAALTRRQMTVIVEDDMIPERFFSKKLRIAIQSLPFGWDIFNFGCSNAKTLKRGPHFCSRGYVLSKKGARQMIRYTKVDDTCDGIILKASSTLNAYHKSLPIVHGSYLNNQMLPRGTDLCNRSDIDIAASKRRARDFYARASRHFQKKND
jgi:hypothetical protein